MLSLDKIGGMSYLFAAETNYLLASVALAVVFFNVSSCFHGPMPSALLQLDDKTSPSCID